MSTGPTSRDGPSTAIRISGLVKRFDRTVAVDGLDLEVRPGECFALLGPNGAGKTTTVEIMEGILKPDEGRVEVLGESWGGGNLGLRQRLGIQLQETRFPERLKVRETVALFRSLYRRGPSAADTMRRVRIEDKAGDLVKHLSGGQRQRLSLACALVGDPDLLFLDEPTTGLDPQSRLQIWDIVSELRQKGKTVLLTTHYMEEAQRLCDRVAIIDYGKLMALGSPGELIASLGAQHIVEFDTKKELDCESLARIDGVHGAGQENGTVRLTVEDVHRALRRLLRQLETDGVEIENLTTHHATLEDVFVALTGRHLREE